MILGLETSTHSGGAALLEFHPQNQGEDAAAAATGAKLIGSLNFSTKQLYSQRLLPSIQWLMDRTQITTAQVDVIGVAIGPGSFTGLRIGLSVAKALAYACGARIVGVGTLEALAVRASGGRDATVCPVLDARHGQVYAALYRVDWSHGWPRVQQLRDDWAGPAAEIAAWIDGPTVFAGDAMALLEQHLQPTLKDHFGVPPHHHTLPHPEEVALLTAVRAAENRFDDLAALEPQYVRQSYTAATGTAPS